MNMTENQREQRLRHGIRARNRTERRFRWLGAAAIAVGVLFLLWLMGASVWRASGAFSQTYIAVDINLAIEMDGVVDNASEAQFDAADQGKYRQAIADAPFARMIKSALRADFPQVTGRKEKRELYQLVSDGAEYDLRDAVLSNHDLIGQPHRYWLLADAEVDMLMKGYIDREQAESNRRLSDQTIAWIDELIARERIEKRFNMPFFTAGDSRNAEQAGILGAAMGSVFTLLVTMLLALPVGIAAAIYLQEFAPPRNKFSKLVDLVEVNINNLAAVPSIIFGLLGLAVLINYFGMPRSAPLVGGMVLALMTLPTIIISSRAALAAVPPRIRQAALGVGASGVQTVVHHILPLALPGMLTGAIIGLARALGETAPLLVIGMVAFIVDIPGTPTDPATALPVQIYLWADSPERAFVERTAAAILVLLVVLAVINGLLAVLRNKVEKRW